MAVFSVIAVALSATATPTATASAVARAAAIPPAAATSADRETAVKMVMDNSHESDHVDNRLNTVTDMHALQRQTRSLQAIVAPSWRLVREGVECLTDDIQLGVFADIDRCALACAGSSQKDRLQS
eukprot:6214270-Pleurochrysis_carterae.AAC.2